MAGLTMLHVELADGTSADFPPSSLHYIRWLPEGTIAAREFDARPALTWRNGCICSGLACRDGEDIDERPDCPVHGTEEGPF